MLIVVVMIGLMALFAWPKVLTIFNQSQVRSARLAVLNKFNQTRINARQTSRSAFLIRSGDVMWIERRPRVLPGIGTRDTVGGFLNLGSGSYGVSVTVTGGSDTVTVDPRGLTTGTWRIVLARGGVRDSVVISGFGRVTR
jgi:Tfp pilus assembly protein FimT